MCSLVTWVGSNRCAINYKSKISASLVQVLPGRLAHVAVSMLLVNQHHALTLQLVPDHIGLLVLALLPGFITLVYHAYDLILLETILFGSCRVEEVQSRVDLL